MKQYKKNSIEHYVNKVFNMDVFDLLDELPAESVDLVYGDPDYNVGVRYNNKTYTKSFDEYIDWYIELAKRSLRVLKKDGNMFLINYSRQNAYLWVKYLDNACYDVREYVWIYNTNIGHSKHRFTTAHRTILHCRKSKNNKFYKDNVAMPYENPEDKRIKKLMAQGSKGKMPYSWFYFDLVKNVSREKTYHPCQIPQKLVEMLFKAATKEGDIIFVLFGGSGSEIEIARNLNRNYISAEIDRDYYEMILDRLEKGKIDDKYRMLTRIKAKKKEKPYAETVV